MFSWSASWKRSGRRRQKTRSVILSTGVSAEEHRRALLPSDVFQSEDPSQLLVVHLARSM